MTLEDVQSEKLALKRSSDTLPVDSPKAIKRRRTAPVDLQPSSLSTDKARIVPDGTALQPVSQNAHTESLSSAASKSTSQTASGAKGTASLDAKNGVESDDDYSDLSSVVASDSESDEVGRPLRKVQKVNGHTPMFEAQKLRTPSPEIQEPNHGQDHGPCETNLVPPVIPTLARDKPSARKRTIREPPAGRKRKVTTESPRVGQEARERRCSNRLDHTEKGSLQAQNTPVKPFDAAGTRRTPRRVGRRKNIDVQGSNPQVPENDTFSPDVTESEERTRPTSNGNDTGTSLGLGEESAATTTSVNEENSEMQGTQASPLLDGDSVVSSVLELSKTLDEEELGGAERKRTHDTEVAVSPSAKAQSSVSVMKPDVDEHSSYRPSSDHSDVDSSTRSSRRAHLRRSKAKNIIRIPAVDTPLSKKLRKLDISDASVLEQARGNPVQTNAESTSAVGKGGAELVAVGRSQRQVQVICRSSMHMENVRVQSSRCKTRSYARYPACSACVGAQAGATCRFLDFRAFLCGNQPKDHAVFLSDDAADDLGLDKLASLQHFPTLSKDLEYKLFLSYDAFIASAEKELAHIPADDQDKRGRDDGMPLHCIKRPLPNVRQSCDACEQGIYNVHYYCVKCGRDYCITCFEEHWMAASDSLDDGRNREQSSTEPKTRSIHYCRKSKTEGIKFHGYRDMLVISRWSKKQMQDALGWVKRWMDIHRERVRDRIQHDEECAAGMANQASDQPLTSERNDADGQERSEETSLISSPCEILEEHLEVGRKPTENTPHEHGNSNKLSVPTITDGQLLHNHPETMLTDEPGRSLADERRIACQKLDVSRNVAETVVTVTQDMAAAGDGLTIDSQKAAEARAAERIMSKILGVLPTNVDNSKEDETLSAGSNPLSTIPVPESLTPVPPFPADELLNARHPDLVIIPYKDLTLSLFQKHWRARKAIMVTGMADRVTEDWEPQVFAEIAGMEEAGIVNCETDMVTPEMKLSDFFGGFGRIRPKKGPVEKLKDWPTDSHFRDKLPHQHAKFLELIPVPEYTHPTGSFNMAGHIAESDVPPDLGPKMYAAYGYRPNTTGGTTKLHLDVADAANVMVWTKGHWENGQDGKDYSTHRLSGAIWDLFPPHSLTTLRNYLRQDYADVSKKIHKKFPEKIDDPIHDQTFFLHPAHLVDLQRRHGVTPIRVHQAVGDAIFVPAGFAHQVSNYGDSIKCALDFVSSEGIGVCETLCGEFRKLKKGHGRRGDTLCVAKVVWGVVRSAMLEAGSKQDGEPTATQVPEDVAESVPLSDTPAPTVA